MAQAPSTRDFETAERYFGDLSVRQREVLQLVARGHTNPEIAANLGITLDGAKWHVSELLGKLGLESREELVEFWEWQHRPVRRMRRMVRGLIAIPAFKVVGSLAGVAIVAAIGFGAWALFGGDDSGSGGGGSLTQPFVLEASITIDSPDDKAVASAGATVEQTEHLQWWYSSADTWKWQLTTNIGDIDQQTLMITSDDGHGTAYNSLTNTYSKAELQRFPDGTVAPPTSTLLLGPVGFYAKTPDAFVAMLRQSSDGQPARQAAIVGDDTVLGRHTVIIDTPASYSTSSDSDIETPSGTMRMWLDPERMTVLKIVNQGDVQTYTAQVTSLDWDARLTTADVAFQSPNGATKTDGPVSDVAVSNSGGSVGPIVHAPAGFMVPAHVPTGLVATESSQASTVGINGPVTFIVKYVASQGGTVVLTVQETLRADGLPGSLKTGTATKVNDFDAWANSDGATNSLVWEQAGLAIQITAAGVDAPELMQMAQSMRPGDGQGAGPTVTGQASPGATG